MPSLVRPDGCRLHCELAGIPVPRCSCCWKASEATSRPGGGTSRRSRPRSGSSRSSTEATVGATSAHLYGQSFGGMVAQEAALTHADRVRTLVLAGTHPGPAHAIAVADRTVPKGEPWRALYAPGFPELHPDAVADDLRAMAAQPDHPRGQRREWEAMQAWDDFDRLPRTTVPTLVLHGTEDRVVAPGNAELLARRIPDFIDRHRDA